MAGEVLTFHVNNFEKFQHYKDRSPPWIKLYTALLEKYDFARLPDASKAHLIAIWLLASRSDNKLPYDAVWIRNRINATCDVDLDLLVSAEFIVIDQPLRSMEQDASNLRTERLTRERGREETEGEKISVAKATGAVAPQPVSEIVSRETSLALTTDDELLDVPGNLRRADEPWKQIYDGYKRHLGTRAGGLISKIRGVSGLPEMAGWLEQLERGEIADPREYFGAIVAKRVLESTQGSKTTQAFEKLKQEFAA